MTPPAERSPSDPIKVRRLPVIAAGQPSKPIAGDAIRPNLRAYPAPSPVIGPVSQTAEYALRVVAHLASLEGQPATTKELAVATRIPEGYLAKVVRSLNRSHLVISQRGLHGGSILARPAEDITVYDVVNAVTPLPRIRTCPLGIRSHGTSLCPLHRKLDDAIALVERTFKASTMADLMKEPSRSKPLCDVSDIGGAGIKGKLASGPIPLTVSRQSR